MMIESNGNITIGSRVAGQRAPYTGIKILDSDSEFQK